MQSRDVTFAPSLWSSHALFVAEPLNNSDPFCPCLWGETGLFLYGTTLECSKAYVCEDLVFFL